jgi:hypothetical protein
MKKMAQFSNSMVQHPTPFSQFIEKIAPFDLKPPMTLGVYLKSTPLGVMDLVILILRLQRTALARVVSREVLSLPIHRVVSHEAQW